MKHLRNLALLLAVITLLASLCACGEEATNKEDNKTTTISEETTDNITPEDVTTPVVSTDSAYITSKEDMDLIIDTIPDANYTVSERTYTDTNSTHYTYDLTTNTNDYNFNYKVKLGDGTEFTMPVSVKDIEASGWSTTISKDETYAANSAPASSFPFINSNNNEIGCYIRNNNSNDATLEECDITGIELNLYKFGYTPSYHIEKDDKAIDFTICDNITNDSTIEDVINSLGAPTKIRLHVCGDHGGYCDVELVYVQNSNAKQQITFIFSGDENRIMQFHYLAG